MKFTLIFLTLLLLLAEEAKNTGVCVVRMVNGKLQKNEDCGNNRNSQVLEDLDGKLDKQATPNSCQYVKKSNAKVENKTGGVFDIYPDSLSKKIEVYCDLETEGNRWTVFQRRMDGSEDFLRGWNDYVNGFGEKDREFWLGLENLHQMTRNGKYELRIDLQDFSGNTAYAKYESFRIGSSAKNYTLHISSFSGNASDSLDYHNGSPFSTKDRENDIDAARHCAKQYKGAWWHKNCLWSNLNALYHNSSGRGWDGVVWYDWKGYEEYLKFTEMKFRKTD